MIGARDPLAANTPPDEKEAGPSRQPRRDAPLEAPPASTVVYRVSTATRRLLALVAAIALVVAAAVVGPLVHVFGGDGSSKPSHHHGSGAGNIRCDQELAEPCNALARATGITVDIQPAGTTVSELSKVADARGVAYDGWLTFTRDAEIVREARVRASLGSVIGSPLGPIGRSPLLLVVSKERETVLAKRCGGTITWKCVGEVAGTRWDSFGGQTAWGRVKAGHLNPSTTGEGLAVIGQEAAQFFGRVSLSRDDFQNDNFLQWFTQLERAVPSSDPEPLNTMLTTSGAAYDVVATTEAVAAPLLAGASSATRNVVDLLYPAPVATADIVYAPVSNGSTDVRDSVAGDDGRRALARAGWRVGGEPFAKGITGKLALPPLARRSNLPDAGTLAALLETWREVVA